jgi:hypothetical protein
MGYRTATFNVAWQDDDVDFYHRVVDAVSRNFGVKASGLWQPAHDPVFAFHTRYSMTHPKAKTGEMVKITVSFYHDRTGWPLEVTSFSIVEYAPPKPPPAPVPATPPPPPPVEWKLTVYEAEGSGFFGFSSLKVKLRLPGGTESWYTTNLFGEIYLKEPAITAGKVDIVDILDDGGTPNIPYSSFARAGFPTGGKYVIRVPNKRKVIDNIISTAGVFPRVVYGKKTPNYSKMDLDWDYEIVTLHHSGNSGEQDPAKIEAEHMGSKGYDDVGYHYMVNLKGRIYEGRNLAFKGSHVELANTGKIGILVMGDFEHQWWDSDDDPTKVQLDSVKSLIKTLMASFPTIKKLGGHKDYKPSTECPGEELYKLIPGIRGDVGLSGP